MAEKITVRVARNLGYLGVIAGAYCGFLARDEYYFSTFQRVHELSDEFYRKEELLDLETSQIQAQVAALKAEQLKALKNEKKQAAGKKVTQTSGDLNKKDTDKSASIKTKENLKQQEKGSK